MEQLKPSLTVLGVYHVPYVDYQLRRQLNQYYFFGNAARDTNSRVRQYIKRCVPLVLFEIALDHLDERFSFNDFTQEMPGAPREAWQTAYEEAVLSFDGSQLLARGPFCTKELRSGRAAFYFHFYDPDQPMRWPYGEFPNPPMQAISQRLWALMPYSPVD